MARFRSSIRPVNRIKHVFDKQGATTAGTQVNETIVLTKDAPVLANTQECATASTINGFFITCEINATTSAALPNVYFILWKNPGGNLTNITANTVGADDNKRFVFHQEMVMLQQQTNSNPRTLFKGVIKVPKGYRRNAPNDTTKIGILAPGVNINYCLQVHYKEFR